MAKPILVINYCVDGMSMDKTMRNLQELQKIVSESNANDEYYTFLLPVTGDSNIQVFYDKDQNEIQYEELRNMVEVKMKFFEERASEEKTPEYEDEDIFFEEESKFKTFLRKIGILPRL